MKKFKIFIFSLLLVSCHTVLNLQAQNNISIKTLESELVFQVDENNRLFQAYFGRRLLKPSEEQKFPRSEVRAYPTFGTSYYNEAAMRVVHADGNTSTELKYVEHSHNDLGDGIIHTVIELRDEHYPFYVYINFKAFSEENIIEQWVEIRHDQTTYITLFNFASSHIHFSEPTYYLTQFYGNWADEMRMTENRLSRGIKNLESKLGVRSNQHAHACFLLSLDGPLNENSGRVVGGTLAWPGSWRLSFDVDHLDHLHVISGINPYASHYYLEPGEIFKTASFLFSFSDEGSGNISRSFHRWAIKHGIYRGDRPRMTLLNNWEATYFDFNQEVIKGLIKDAANMGFELFLLDDGWFGDKHPRNNDDAGLGDWMINREKLPNGIGYLVEEATRNGIRFGLWLEPEMVNPRSELYEKHPDWVIGQPHRDHHLLRNQLNLDLSNPKVREFVFNVIDQTLVENPGIAYIKWDANRFITNSGSYFLAPDRQSHLWIENVRGLFYVLDKVREKHKDVYMMACAGGGGRVDYGTLPYFDEFWISDNTDALDRVFIQWGTTYFFPAVAVASHVSVVPNHITGRTVPLKFRFDVAMSGKLGMDLQPRDMTPGEKDFSKNALQEYNRIREIVHFGDLYRLLSPYENERAAMMFVEQGADRAVVFSYLLKKAIYGNNQPLYLRGLSPEKKYKIIEINKDPDKFSWIQPLEGLIFTGDFLMNHGLRFPMYDEFESRVILLEAQP